MTSVRNENPADTTLSSPLLNASDLSSQLAALQAGLMGLQQTWGAHLPVLPSASSQDHNYLMRIMQSHMAATSGTVSELRTEVTAMKTRLQGLSSPTGVCSGPMALAAFLLAISFVAIIIIVLASLGLAGVLPQASALLVNTSNTIWAIVSASIVAVICLVSVLCVTLIRHHRPLPIEVVSTGN
ncbi:inclusion membrane protein [Chlamydia felis Fe/C-56]|uniref:Inclusion membrane protein n=1 Tax=Chlamydia felis (strain Fe/C-56) TaxID=264202 RepID=Q254J9_CHLFF|nr:hypothetical protein [Chlamydia felis]BAE81289.1 inclusion membrane protein [Chlamydia felis Fe/C-56]